MSRFVASAALITAAIALLQPAQADAQHIAGIRLTQTGNDGLALDFDVTVFYTTGSTETTAHLGTYYNHVPAVDFGDGQTVARYGVGTSTGIPLTNTSAVVNGIPVRAYRGSFSHTYGSVGAYTISANTACCPLTTPTYTLASGNIITTSFTTSTPFSTSATITTSVVQNTLPVDIQVPLFSKANFPDSIEMGMTSTVTYTIDNSGSTFDANGLSLAETLPAGLEIAATPNAGTTCTGGTLTAVAASSSITYVDGLVATGESCTVSVDVVGTMVGSYSDDATLTSAIGDSGTAAAMLTVTAMSGSDGGVTPPSSSGGGCNCHVGADTKGAGPMALVFGVLGLFWWRRRRFA